MSEPIGGQAKSGLPPLATYRLQFTPEFKFHDAERIIPYLKKLGITHVYASPVLKARTGSTHGYDITDHNVINEELGGEDCFTSFAGTLRANGMGLILDFVPNHMGVGYADNAWWLDVLEWGRASPYAEFFDIDWDPAKDELKGKVLVPFLGDHYGRVLERGELRLRFDETEGSFSVWYHDHRFPITPADYARILAAGLGTHKPDSSETADILLRFIKKFSGLRATRGLSATARSEVRRRSAELKPKLAELYLSNPPIRRQIEISLGEINVRPGEPTSYVALHRLLARQFYRPAFWRVAADEINYRRFFDINELAAIRIERPEVFEAVHRTVLRLISESWIDGLRIDHIDGLFDPAAYLQRLCRALEAAGIEKNRFYLIVEKILAQHEELRRDWPVDGTTGYEFSSLVNGLFVDPSGERSLNRIYNRFTSSLATFDDVLLRSKTTILESSLSGELNVLANELDRISESQWSTRDFTRDGLRQALMQVVIFFPVYRTYVTARGAESEDRRDIDWAVARARQTRPDIDASLFDFVHAVLTTDLVERRQSGYSRRQVVRFAMKFQQFTGPVMAKAFEDTSFYRYNRLIALNDVGGDPRRFGVSLSAFHHLNQERLRWTPHTMLATTTHDSKRSEDVRARIDLLSELPGEWVARVRHWSRINRRARRLIDGRPAPSRNDEYLLYQTLVGLWPNESVDIGQLAPERMDALARRVRDYMTKAAREAKLESGWATPNPQYESAVSDFVTRILEPSQANLFLADFLPFQARIARLGMLNSLSQSVLKLTAPGVPDIYQGSELWNYSLVDPDNRRRVDFRGRDAALAEMVIGFERGVPDHGPLSDDLLANWPDGRIKLFIHWRLLGLRRRHPGLFRDGSYTPLATTGPQADRLCVFHRQYEDTALIVAACRMTASLFPSDLDRPWESSGMSNTQILAPPVGSASGFVDIFTGMTVPGQATDEGILLSGEQLLSRLPVAALFVSGIKT